MPQLIAAVVIARVAGLAVQAIADAQKTEVHGYERASPAERPIAPLEVSSSPGGAQIGVFGHRRMGGNVILNAKSGTKTYIVIVFAGSPLNSVNAVYINDVLCSRDASNNISTTPWATGASVNVKLYDGSQTTSDAVLTSVFPGWTSQFVGRGCTYARIVIDPTSNASAFSGGIPNFTFDVSGFKTYDPRDGTQSASAPATWKYTINAALIHAGYLIHPLGANWPLSRIDWASVATAANVCDETVTLAAGGTEARYTSSLVWSTDERHEAVLQRAAAAHAGGLFSAGGKYQIFSGQFNATTATISPGDYVGNGLSFSDTPPLASVANGVRGQFTSPANNYELRDFPPYQDAAALAEDLGVEYWMAIDLSAVVSASQAQRLARIAYQKARNGFSAAVDLNFGFFDTVANDMISLSDPLAGFMDTTFRVDASRTGPDYAVALTLVRESVGWYAWTASQEKPYTVSILGSASSGGSSGSGGTVTDTGPLQPPGFAVFDARAGSGGFGPYIEPEIFVYASPSVGADQIYARYYDGQIDLQVTISNTTGTVTTAGASQPNGRPGAGAQWTAYARNSATGETSATVAVAVYALADGATEANSATYKLPVPKWPQVSSSSAGSATLFLAYVNCSKVVSVELLESTSSIFSTANLVGTYSNISAGTSVARTGTAGSGKYYWARTKDGSGNVSSASNATLVVF